VTVENGSISGFTNNGLTGTIPGSSTAVSAINANVLVLSNLTIEKSMYGVYLNKTTIITLTNVRFNNISSPGTVEPRATAIYGVDTNSLIIKYANFKTVTRSIFLENAINTVLDETSFNNVIYGLIALSGKNLKVTKVNANLSNDGLNLIQLGGQDINSLERKFINVILTDSNFYGESTKIGASLISVFNSNYACIDSINAALRLTADGEALGGTIVI